jgi:hypothetical protein
MQPLNKEIIHRRATSRARNCVFCLDLDPHVERNGLCFGCTLELRAQESGNADWQQRLVFVVGQSRAVRS